ncbi:MAG: response regulator transcription factor [Opitutaceae bacterium]|nr:response regulator transcription factor [Opitutaceae bacterium]
MQRTNPAHVRILLVDDHPLLRAGLRECLGLHSARFEVVGECGDSESAWREVARLEPDLIVMDLELPGEGGLSLTRRIHAAFPLTKVMILTAYDDGRKINSALEAGAVGYVLKSCASEELITAVEAVLVGQIYLSPAASTVIVRDYQRQLQGGSELLSPRELETLKQIANGQTTKEIAFAQKISPKTVETHRLNLMAKLQISTVAGLTKYAIREGLISP